MAGAGDHEMVQSPAVGSVVASAVHPVAPLPAPEDSLGPRSGWDPALAAVVDLILGCPVPMALTYGPQFLLIYNHAYVALLGDKHPLAFGQPAPEVFGASWLMPGVGDALDRVYRTGESFLEVETLLPVNRGGRVEQAYFSRGYSAVRGALGQIIGTLTVIAETTQTTRRLQRLGELTSALAGALSLDDVVRVTLRWILQTFGVDQAGFAVAEGAGWRTVRRTGGEILDESDERLPLLWRTLPARAGGPLLHAADSRSAFFLDEQELLALEQTDTDRRDRRLRAVAALPVPSGSMRAAISVGYRRPHRWLPAERALLAATAELVGQAVGRAQVFETQAGTSRLLQRSMLPESLPNLPNLRLAARYEPTDDAIAAGGDFYDAFPLDDGRLAVVLGDVAGHDVRAAAVMGQVRAALRALALTDPAPERVLGRLDRLVRSLETGSYGEELFVTVLYGVADPESGSVTFASAGHPPPLLHRSTPGQQPQVGYLDVPPGAPLGLGGTRHTVHTSLQPGDTLLMFSDGVVERRSAPLSAGLDALAQAAAAVPNADARTLCALVTHATAGTPEDDIAALAVQYTTVPSRSSTLEVPADPTAPGRVRRWLTSQLVAWQVPSDLADTAVLCANELATNALLHAGTPARVELDLTTDRLLIAVSDTGTRGVVTRAEVDQLSSRGRGLGLIASLADSWGTDPTLRGATVWFELLLPQARSSG